MGSLIRVCTVCHSICNFGGIFYPIKATLFELNFHVSLQAFPDKTLTLGALPSALRKTMVVKFPYFDKY